MQQYCLDEGYKDGVKVVGIREDDNGPYTLTSYAQKLEEQITALTAMRQKWHDLCVRQGMEINQLTAEIEHLRGANRSILKNRDELFTENAKLREALDRIFQRGHNEDCIFCGLKDKIAAEALKDVSFFEDAAKLMDEAEALKKVT